jgi:hypothetical protein
MSVRASNPCPESCSNHFVGKARLFRKVMVAPFFDLLFSDGKTRAITFYRKRFTLADRTSALTKLEAETSIYINCLAGDVGGGVGSQKKNDTGNFFILSSPFEWDGFP